MQQPTYTMSMELILNKKKGMCLPHVPSSFKKSVLKRLDRTVYTPYAGTRVVT
jgi:hypothetical protein